MKDKTVKFLVIGIVSLYVILTYSIFFTTDTEETSIAAYENAGYSAVTSADFLPVDNTPVLPLQSSSSRQRGITLSQYSMQLLPATNNAAIVLHTTIKQTSDVRPTEVSSGGSQGWGSFASGTTKTTSHISSTAAPTAISLPFASSAPRVLAHSGDMLALDNRAPRLAPRLAPPEVGGGNHPEDTGITDEKDTPLADGTWILLVLAALLFGAKYLANTCNIHWLSKLLK